jgi:hypothetical protein
MGGRRLTGFAVQYKSKFGYEVKVMLSLSLTTYHAMKTYWDSGCIAPRGLNLGTRWRRVVRFISRPLYPTERAADKH